VALGALSSQTASAQGLLTIDDSNPADVIITATGLNPSNGATNAVSSGVDLLAFFTIDVNYTSGNTPLTGTLTGGNSGVAYDGAVRDNQSTAGGANVDLNLFVSPGPNSGSLQTFDPSQPAFTGFFALDLSALDVLSLPTLGTSGNIISGYSGGVGPIIGTWVVVPEPTTTGLTVFGSLAAGIAYLRHRRSLKKA
jgi:hypothetical protein